MCVAIWQSLADQRVNLEYVKVLANLYELQSGRICGEAMRKPFQITRGTKQGDPLSPVLFNSVLEHTIGSIKPDWQRKGFGIKMQDGRLYTYR